MAGRLFGRMVCVLAAAVLCCAAAGAEQGPAALLTSGGAALVNAAGEDVVPFGEYGAIYELGESHDPLFAVSKEGEGAYALMDASGQVLTAFDYQSFRQAEGGVIFRTGSRFGVMDEAGSIVIEPAYTRLVSCGDGGYLALKGDPHDDSPDGVYRVEADGAERAVGVKIRLGLDSFAHGMTAAVSQETGLYGCLDAQGEWVIEPAFRWIGVSRGGMIPAASPEGVGLLGATGEWLVPPEYDYVSCGEDGLILAGRGNCLRVLSPEDCGVVAEYICEGVYGCLMDGGKAAVVDETGAAVLDGRGHEILRLDGCLSVGAQPGMGDQLTADMGGYGTGSVFLYRLDGTVVAGPYQRVDFLGTEAGVRYYAAVSYETVGEDTGDYVFRDEVPGTRVSALIDETGATLASFDAEEIVWLGNGLLLVRQEDEHLLADLRGSVIRRFEGEKSEGDIDE